MRYSEIPRDISGDSLAALKIPEVTIIKTRPDFFITTRRTSRVESRRIAANLPTPTVIQFPSRRPQVMTDSLQTLEPGKFPPQLSPAVLGLQRSPTTTTVRSHLYLPISKPKACRTMPLRKPEPKTTVVLFSTYSGYRRKILPVS
jgi:hypothetical protein